MRASPTCDEKRKCPQPVMKNENEGHDVMSYPHSRRDSVRAQGGCVGSVLRAASQVGDLFPTLRGPKQKTAAENGRRQQSAAAVPTNGSGHLKKNQTRSGDTPWRIKVESQTNAGKKEPTGNQAGGEKKKMTIAVERKKDDDKLSMSPVYVNKNKRNDA